MDCNNNGVCGTGIASTSLPKPGDPSNGSALVATTVFGGISLSWAYPALNPHAVSFTRVYRSTTNNIANAAELPTATGSIYFDRLNPTTDTQYYYWIRMVSVNGTANELVGPASALAVPMVEQTLASLTGRIDAGVLAQALKTKIDSVIDTNRNLDKEIQDRLIHNGALQTALNSVQRANGDTATYVRNEITERKDANSAIVTSINGIAAGASDNTAAIVTERIARVTKDDALALDITTLATKTGENAAAIIKESQTRTTKTDAIAIEMTALVTTTGANTAAIKAESIARTSAIEAATTATNIQITKLGTDTAAAIKSESDTRVTEVSAVSTKVDTVESRINGNVVLAETRVQTNVNLLGNKVSDIGALWTTKVSVNGLIGGFGVYNDGRSVEAGFDVDLFWVGRTNADKVKPFIISDGVVYIDMARIRHASITTLFIGDNAVNIPVFMGGSGGTNHSAGSAMQKVGSVVVSFPATTRLACTLAWQCIPGGTSTNTKVEIRIAGGGTLLSYTGSILGGFRSSHTTIANGQLIPGSYTFEFWVGNDWNAGSYTLGQWGCTILGVMK